MRAKLGYVLFLLALTLPAYSGGTKLHAAPPGPFRSDLLSAVTTGTSAAIDASDFESMTFYLVSTGTTSSGTVILEEADWDPHGGTPYSGTWSAIATINASTFTGGAQVGYHVQAPTAYGFVRARIGTSIGGGGTVSVALRMH